MNTRLALAITGASGSPYALRLLEVLLSAGEEVDVMISDAGRMVLEMEAGLKLPSRPRDAQAVLTERFGAAPSALRLFGRKEWTAPVASGSGAPRAMIICPCTTGTLAAVAQGMSDNLIERAADVVLKERRPLVLVVRETPFSAIHLENMLRLARVGATILPANPGFYHQPKGVADLVDFVVARVLDHVGVAHRLLPAWGEEPDR